MGYVVENGVVVTKNPNTTIVNRKDQVAGFEQFVMGKKVKLTESLPAMEDSNYEQEYTYIVPIMENNGHPYGGVYSSLTGAEKYDAYKVFSRDSSAVITWGGVTHGWITYDFEQPTYVHSYILSMPYAEDVNSFPRSWKVYGSDDNRNWVEIDSRYYQNLEVGTKNSYECIAPHSFRYVQFIFSEIRGNVGYATIANIDYFGIARLAFTKDFNSTMPVFMHHTEYQDTVENFASVVKYPDLYKDPDPFGDGSQICYVPMDDSLEDITGNLTFNAVSFTPKYCVGRDGHKALDYSTYNQTDYIKSTTQLPIENYDAITVCAWARQDWYNYSEWQNVWKLANVDDNYVDGGRVSGLWYVDDQSTRLHVSTYSGGKTYGSYSPIYTITRHKWQLLTIIQRQYGFELYVDGKFINGVDTFKTTQALLDSWVYIGDRWHYKAYQLQEFRIFNRALTREEMGKLQFSGKTVATLSKNRKPKAFSIIDSSHKFNRKELPLIIESVELVKTRKKYRYIDYRLLDGNSVNSSRDITEIQAFDDSLNILSIGAPVIVDSGDNKDYITDGIIDIDHYYSNGSNAYVRIDLGEPRDIRYLQFWNWFGDARYYKNIQVALTNEPSNYYYRLEKEGYIFQTIHRGHYTETSGGKTVSNLNFDYEFKVTYSLPEFYYPPEFYVEVALNYGRKNSKFIGLTRENQRNLWFIKPRVNLIANEYEYLQDKGGVSFPRYFMPHEDMDIIDVDVIHNPELQNIVEGGEVIEQPIGVTTQGLALDEGENGSIFESQDYALVTAYEEDSLILPPSTGRPTYGAVYLSAGYDKVTLTAEGYVIQSYELLYIYDHNNNHVTTLTGNFNVVIPNIQGPDIRIERYTTYSGSTRWYNLTIDTGYGANMPAKVFTILGEDGNIEDNSIMYVRHTSCILDRGVHRGVPEHIQIDDTPVVVIT